MNEQAKDLQYSTAHFLDDLNIFIDAFLPVSRLQVHRMVAFCEIGKSLALRSSWALTDSPVDSAPRHRFLIDNLFP